MFFCEKCRYLYNVTKDVHGKQTGGKTYETLTKLLEKFKKNEKIVEEDLGKIEGKELLDDERFENMTKKDQRKLISIVKGINKDFFATSNSNSSNNRKKIGGNVAYFICKYCRFYKPIEPGTIIYSKNYGYDSSIETEDYTYAVYDQTLPRTKNYVCKKPTCESHKNDEVKEAIITKNTAEQIVYICTNCLTSWIYTL
jgi:hypothetical protein